MNTLIAISEFFSRLAKRITGTPEFKSHNKFGAKRAYYGTAYVYHANKYQR